MTIEPHTVADFDQMQIDFVECSAETDDPSKLLQTGALTSCFTQTNVIPAFRYFYKERLPINDK